MRSPRGGRSLLSTAVLALAVSLVPGPGHRAFAQAANDQFLRTPEDKPLEITLTARGLEGAATFSITTEPGSGSLDKAKLTERPPKVTYTPNENFSGEDGFAFKATADSQEVTGKITIAVRPINDPPVAKAASVSTNEDTPLPITLVATDVDEDGLTYSIVDKPGNGRLRGSPPKVTYTPSLNFSGQDSFTFTAEDSERKSPAATISITVEAVNDPPVAVSQQETTAEDTPLEITLAARDIEEEEMTYLIVSQPKEGSLGGNPPKVTYTPKRNFTGADTFTFKANDGTSDSEPATVSIRVFDPDQTEASGVTEVLGATEPGAKRDCLSWWDACNTQVEKNLADMWEIHRTEQATCETVFTNFVDACEECWREAVAAKDKCDRDPSKTRGDCRRQLKRDKRTCAQGYSLAQCQRRASDQWRECRSLSNRSRDHYLKRIREQRRACAETQRICVGL